MIKVVVWRVWCNSAVLWRVRGIHHLFWTGNNNFEPREYSNIHCKLWDLILIWISRAVNSGYSGRHGPKSKVKSSWPTTNKEGQRDASFHSTENIYELQRDVVKHPHRILWVLMMTLSEYILQNEIRNGAITSWLKRLRSVLLYFKFGETQSRPPTNCTGKERESL